MVPIHNFDLHQVRCVPAVAVAVVPSAPPLPAAPASASGNENAPIYIDHSPQRAPHSHGNNNSSNNGNNVVCLMDDDNDNDDDDSFEIVEDDRSQNNNNDDEWACSRCTLLNPNSARLCDACGLQRPAGASDDGQANYRNPDAVIRERLIPATNYYGGATAANHHPNSNFSSTTTTEVHVMRGSVSGGAVLGGIIGGTSAFMRGESLTSGALNGMMTGAMGGAIAGELARELGDFAASRSSSSSHPMTTRSRAQHNQQDNSGYYGGGNDSVSDGQGSAAASASASSGTSGSAGRPVSRRSVRVVRLNRNPSTDQNAAMMEMMLRSMFAPGAMGVRGGNIDNMTYEQILEAFGDGSENRGADEAMISSLPSSTIGKASELQEDQKQCSICLDEFCDNDRVRRLPCLHYFHEDCVDRWLRSNASCPVCKHHIRG
eukprot:CAMPEP_0196803084 /NCGR_PEP_ID=MMETSP1362-20130617/2520_1 /TAXON_ID=163516 /ORGANISM="Leptocylindrus danicus, Strain CCMP1856" /LENGTH=431 /DNA_ID=CAMNT_0042174517 /DNA_START=144 /DNA_END=1439 /DNA_ORIENTATION=+